MRVVVVAVNDDEYECENFKKRCEETRIPCDGPREGNEIAQYSPTQEGVCVCVLSSFWKSNEYLQGLTKTLDKEDIIVFAFDSIVKDKQGEQVLGNLLRTFDWRTWWGAIMTAGFTEGINAYISGRMNVSQRCVQEHYLGATNGWDEATIGLIGQIVKRFEEGPSFDNWRPRLVLGSTDVLSSLIHSLRNAILPVEADSNTLRDKNVSGELALEIWRDHFGLKKESYLTSDSRAHQGRGSDGEDICAFFRRHCEEGLMLFNDVYKVRVQGLLGQFEETVNSARVACAEKPVLTERDRLETCLSSIVAAGHAIVYELRKKAEEIKGGQEASVAKK